MSLAAAAKQAFRQPAFVAACALLVAAAIGLNAATGALQLYFKKLPVPLAKPLATLPPQMGHWVQLSKDQPLGHDVEETLGAVEYVFRDYVNIDAIQSLDIAYADHDAAAGGGTPKEIYFRDTAFGSKSADERVAILKQLVADRSYEQRRLIAAAIQARNPQAVVNAAVTYYTGMVDTVAHIPDRCYIADGFEPKEYESPVWTAGQGPDGQPFQMPVRFINFEDQTGNRGALSTRSVAYTFYVNGTVKANPLDVRATLQKLTEKYGYYAKIELMTLVRDRAASAAMMADFLAAARPDIERCLPDWAALTSGNTAVARNTPPAGAVQPDAAVK